MNPNVPHRFDVLDEMLSELKHKQEQETGMWAEKKERLMGDVRELQKEYLGKNVCLLLLS